MKVTYWRVKATGTDGKQRESLGVWKGDEGKRKAEREAARLKREHPTWNIWVASETYNA